jgi:hypothetical protein
MVWYLVKHRDNFTLIYHKGCKQRKKKREISGKKMKKGGKDKGRKWRKEKEREGF